MAELQNAIDECAQTLAYNGPTGMRLQKTLMRDWEQLPLDQAIDAGIDALAEAYKKGEPNAFIQKAIAIRKS